MTSKQLNRFWSLVDRNPDGCWNWTGRRDKDGYGLTGFGKRSHRISYQEAFTWKPGKLWVCHTCDNPGCVRPSHLFLGTALDNNRDAKNKGRHSHGKDHARRLNPVRGSKSGVAVITESWVPEIRALYKSGVRQGDIAKKFGVSISAVNHCCAKRTWRHII